MIVPLVALSLAVAWWRDMLPRRAWWLVVGLSALLFASGLCARHTGEADEERVEAVVGEARIEAHEEAATTFVIGSALVLALATGAALLRPRTAALVAAATTVAAGAVVLGLGYRVGQAGGELVYRHGAASAFVTPPAGPATTSAHQPGRALPAAPERNDDDD